MSSLPIYLHSGMQSAPTYTSAAGSFISVLDACLVTGFNTQPVSSATASGGVVTFNFPSAPGFSALDTVAVAGSSASAANGVFRVLSAANNQVLVSIPGVSDGAVGGTLTMKFAPLGWDKPHFGTNVAVFRPADLTTTRPYLRVQDSVAGGSARYRGYLSMSSEIVGNNPFPSVAQIAGEGVEFNKAHQSSLGHWAMIGDGGAFYFLGEYSPGSYFPFAFGELISYKPADSYRAFVLGTHQGLTGTSNSGQQQKWVARSWAGLGDPAVLENSFSQSYSQFPDAVSGLVVVSRPVLNYEQALRTIRGEVPGQCCVHVSPGSHPQGVHIYTGVPGVDGRLAVWSDVSGICGFVLDEAWRA